MIALVARDLFEMHARDEEDAEILPLMASTLSADELDALGRDMLVEQARIRPQIFGRPARAA